MTTDSPPRFNVGDTVLHEDSGQLYTVINMIPAHDRNFQNQRFVVTYSLVVEEMFSDIQPAPRTIINEMEFVLYRGGHVLQSLMSSNSSSGVQVTTTDSQNLVSALLTQAVTIDISPAHGRDIDFSFPEEVDDSFGKLFGYQDVLLPGPDEEVKQEAVSQVSVEKNDTQARQIRTQSKPSYPGPTSTAEKSSCSPGQKLTSIGDTGVAGGMEDKVAADDNEDSMPGPSHLVDKPPANKAKKFKYTPQLNAFGDIVKTKDGEELEPGTDEYLKEIGERNRYTKETVRKNEREWAHFKEYVVELFNQDTWDRLVDSTLDEKRVDNLLSNYMKNRPNFTNFYKTGEFSRLDTNTVGPTVSRLTRQLEEHTRYRPKFDQRFQLYKTITSDYCKESAKTPGSNQLSGTMDPLTASEMMYIFQSGAVSLWTGDGLVNGTLILSVCTFALRVKEAFQLEFGNFHPIFNSEGQCTHIIYVAGPSKMRKGNIWNNNKTLKRPISACSQDPDYDLWNFLQSLKNRLHPKVLEEYQGREDEIPLWWTPVGSKVPPSQPLFLSTKMGKDKFETIVKSVVWESGISCQNRKIANSSLRCTTFNQHTALTIDAVDRQSMTGHVNPSTAIHYTRRDERKNHSMGAAMLERLTGTKAKPVDFDSVTLQDGRVVFPRRGALPHAALFPLDEEYADADDNSEGRSGEDEEQSPVKIRRSKQVTVSPQSSAEDDSDADFQQQGQGTRKIEKSKNPPTKHVKSKVSKGHGKGKGYKQVPVRGNLSCKKVQRKLKQKKKSEKKSQQFWDSVHSSSSEGTYYPGEQPTPSVPSSYPAKVKRKNPASHTVSVPELNSASQSSSNETVLGKPERSASVSSKRKYFSSPSARKFPKL